jgi:hypothetical protein
MDFTTVTTTLRQFVVSSLCFFGSFCFENQTCPGNTTYSPYNVKNVFLGTILTMKVFEKFCNVFCDLKCNFRVVNLK